MSDILEKQTVFGRFLDLTQAAKAEVKVKLNERLTLYKEETQVVGDEKTVDVNQIDGTWQTELLDTDNMSDGVYYEFNLNGRIYRKLVPVSVAEWEFHMLPNALSDQVFH